VRALVINLAAATARMAFQRQQLQSMHISYDRLEAVTGQALPYPAEHPCWQLWERPMRVTEMAAYASHRNAWQIVLDGSEPILVLEDDALLMPGAPKFLDQIAGLAGLDHVTIECRGRRKLLAREPHPQAPMRRLWQDRSGAAAYVLWPSGAKKLLARAPGLADAVICAAYELNSYQADPALAIQADQCETHGIAPPISAVSSILAEKRPPLSDLPLWTQARYRFRRVKAQARMGIRQIARFRGSQSVMVRLDGFGGGLPLS
jgi:glycosyl transferase, family 25